MLKFPAKITNQWIINNIIINDRIKEPVYIKRDLLVYRHLIQNVPELSNLSVLDFGCGWGDYSLEFSKIVKNVDSFDIDNDHLQVLKQRIYNQGINNINIISNLDDDTKYDIILVYHLLHIPFTHNSIKNLSRNLKNTGIIIFVTWNNEFSFFSSPKDYLQYHKEGKVEWLIGNTGEKYNLFIKSELEISKTIQTFSINIDKKIRVPTLLHDILWILLKIINQIKSAFSKKSHDKNTKKSTGEANYGYYYKFIGAVTGVLGIIEKACFPYNGKEIVLIGKLNKDI